jgi:hypothetical protein
LAGADAALCETRPVQGGVTPAPAKAARLNSRWPPRPVRVLAHSVTLETAQQRRYAGRMKCFITLACAAALGAGAPDSPGGVVVEICEDGVPVKTEWPAQKLAAAERWEQDAFAFFQLPHKYVETGIRADRSTPFLLRASATIQLPAGKHRVLLRGRGACRLSIDGKLLLSTPFPPPITDGHNEIPTDYLDLGPDFRFAPPGNRETWTHFSSAGGKHAVLLESIIGGKRGNGLLRPEPGETVVAIALEGSTSFHLAAPKRVIPYTDAAWKTFAAEESTLIARLEAERRAAAFERHAAEWTARHESARKWIARKSGPQVPPLPAGYPANNAIDHFIAQTHAEAARRIVAEGSRLPRLDFAADVRPILEAKCYSCHYGAKVKGGLRLDREGVLEGGDSGEPAIVAGRPEKSLLLPRVRSDDKARVMPPTGERLDDKSVKLLETWIKEGASFTPRPAKVVTLTPLADDLTFLRRVALDTVGVIPSPAEIDAFLADSRPDKRARAIDGYLADPRWADHWVGYWQDVLAENPNILNPTLNNTGPFRWWIYEAMRDNKPMDLFVFELLQMRGSHYLGGPVGFAAATQNDVPMAEKAAIVASAFLGVQMKCARCHDAPAHRSTQKELFQIAAMLNEKPLAVPKTSSVPLDKFHQGRKPLISVTLKPGTKVAPAWPFASFSPGSKNRVDDAASQRSRLADLITAPDNERFAQVIANRVWKRFMGRGIIEPVDDWEKGEATHPELLRWLGREFVDHGYDLKHLARVILNSHAYQRAAAPELADGDPLHAAPARRRLTAEQIVDSLFAAAGLPMNTEEVNLDIDGGRDMKNSISLGKPRRAWQFASTSNERDRPSLALPKVQAVIDVLEAFGWRSSRQFPLTDREDTPNTLQPAILANGTMAVWLTRLSDEHGVTALALEDRPLDEFIERLYLRVLTRRPSPEENARMVEYLDNGYVSRVVENPPEPTPKKRQPPKYVSWSNHLTPEANQIKVQLEAETRRGETPTARLDVQWRQRLEDVVWALLNAPEMVHR